MTTVTDTIRKYMEKGLSVDEAISKWENDLWGKLSEDMKDRIKYEINFEAK